MANIFKIHPKTINKLQLAIMVISLAAILVASYFFFRPHPQTSNLTTQDTVAKQAKASQDLYAAADKAASLGDYGKGQSILDATLKDATADAARSDIYGKKAILALNNTHNDEAMTFAKQSEQLNPTRLTAHVLAQVAEKVGDRALALKYYKLTVERTDVQQQQLNPGDYIDLQSKVKEFSS